MTGRLELVWVRRRVDAERAREKDFALLGMELRQALDKDREGTEPVLDNH